MGYKRSRVKVLTSGLLLRLILGVFHFSGLAAVNWTLNPLSSLGVVIRVILHVRFIDWIILGRIGAVDAVYNL